MRERLHVETVVRSTGKKPGGRKGGGREVFRDEQDHSEGLLHDPVAVDEKSAGYEKEEASEEDDLVADAGGHGGEGGDRKLET